MQFTSVIVRKVARHNLSVAVLFWGGWLALAVAEASVGAHAVLGVLYGLSLPLLVGGALLIVRYVLLVLDLGHRLLDIAAFGIAVLLLASFITGIGLLAASSLKQLLIGS